VPVPGGWELVLIVLVVMVLFGAKRLPDSARALGRSMRILKAETKGMREDDRDTTVTAQPLPPVQQQEQPYGGQPQNGQPAPGSTTPSGSAGPGEQAPRSNP
jgi:sec-independent protein translocase protein TatA